MKTTILSSLLAAAVWGTAALPAAAQNLAIVNGKPVPVERAHALKQQLQLAGREVPPEMEGQLREEIISREILAQEASRLGLDRTAAFKEQLELARQTVLIRELFLEYAKKYPVTDAEVQAEYDKFVAANQGKEYRASHILVDSEDRAKAIIAELKSKKKTFADIAKKESKDPGSGSRGGDLGWADPDRYVPEFSAALQKLAKGGLTTEPVKSDFGWHIIRLDDVRDPQLPKLEDVKEQIVQELEQRKIVQYQEDLRGKAKVE